MVESVWRPVSMSFNTGLTSLPYKLRSWCHDRAGNTWEICRCQATLSFGNKNFKLCFLSKLAGCIKPITATNVKHVNLGEGCFIFILFTLITIKNSFSLVWLWQYCRSILPFLVSILIWTCLTFKHLQRSLRSFGGVGLLPSHITLNDLSILVTLKGGEVHEVFAFLFMAIPALVE